MVILDSDTDTLLEFVPPIHMQERLPAGQRLTAHHSSFGMSQNRTDHQTLQMWPFPSPAEPNRQPMMRLSSSGNLWCIGRTAAHTVQMQECHLLGTGRQYTTASENHAGVNSEFFRLRSCCNGQVLLVKRNPTFGWLSKQLQGE